MVSSLLEVFDTPRGRMIFASRGVLSLALGLFLAVALPQLPVESQTVQTNASVLSPDYISDRDRDLYQSLFALGERADPAQADAILAQIDNKILTGHILARRYTGGGYNSTREELVAWLTQYADHPEAAAIKRLAASKGVPAATLVQFETRNDSLKGSGYIDHVGKRPMPDGWYRGLSLWKEGQYASAAKQFTAIGENEKLSGWHRAAGYYWAARADTQLGHRRLANSALKKAAQFPTTFYGLLAARERGYIVEVAAKAPHVPAAVARHPNAVRARALAAIGELAMAETELRHLYTLLDKDDRTAVVTLASGLNLANLQVRLAYLKELSDEEQVFAAYPMPSWLALAQTTVDPALVMAIARQESVFREDATSQAGAVGMMQMLPSTARMMLSGLKDEGVNLASVAGDSLPMAEQLTNPQLNIRLGAQYVRHLMEQPYIGNSLIKVLAGYNAGPGSVSAWQKTAAKIGDPLLYIESIPYSETRNYVMQVMAHYWVYQSLMREPTASLDTLASGGWPTV